MKASEIIAITIGMLCVAAVTVIVVFALVPEKVPDNSLTAAVRDRDRPAVDLPTKSRPTGDLLMEENVPDVDIPAAVSIPVAVSIPSAIMEPEEPDPLTLAEKVKNLESEIGVLRARIRMNELGLEILLGPNIQVDYTDD